MDTVKGLNENKQKEQERGPEENPGDQLHCGVPRTRTRTRTQWGLGVQSPGGRTAAVEAEAGTQATNGAKWQEHSRS